MFIYVQCAEGMLSNANINLPIVQYLGKISYPA